LSTPKLVLPKTPIFTRTGDEEKDFWLIDGLTDFAVIPPGIIPGISHAMPIRLPFGNTVFGSNHILHGHGDWVMKNEPSGCVATLVWRKLNHKGMMYVEQDSKLNLNLTISPNAILILKKFSNFYSVTTLYPFLRKPQGKQICRYNGRNWAYSPKQEPIEPESDESLLVPVQDAT
jgi:hypothetical protein